MIKTALILLNWNAESDTVECINSLMNTDMNGMSVTVFIVDNGSDYKSYNKLKDFTGKLSGTNPSVQLIRSTQNNGFAGGNNIGIKEAIKQQNEYIVLLNNDTIVDRKFLKPLIEILQNNTHIGIAGPKIYFVPGYEYHKNRYKKSETGKVIWYAGGLIDWDNVYPSHRGVDEVDAGQFNTGAETDFISGCCLAFRASLVNEIGYLKNYYFVYYEDVDFCMNARKKNYGLYFVPESIIWHKNARSSGSAGSEVQTYYQTRNRLIFGMKFAPLKTKAALIRESITQFVYNKRLRKAVSDFYFLRWGRKK